MDARTRLKAIAGAVSERRWLCACAAMTLALVVGPGSAVAAERGSGGPVCPIMQQTVPSATVQVPAKAGPTGFPGATGEVDTGVCVRRSVTVTATGAIGIDGTQVTYGPQGATTTTAGPGFPLQGVPKWSLIGRIGNGPWQYIGAGPTTLVGRGELYLAVNDDFLSDNSRSFMANISQCGCGDHFWSAMDALA